MDYSTIGDGSVTFTLNQTQSHASVSFFELPVPIKLFGPFGQDTIMVLNNITNGEQFTVFPGFWVDSIQFDPDMWLIAQASSITIGIEGEDLLKANIYPNPAHDFMNVQFDSEIENISANIFDLSGRIVFSSNLPNGMQCSIPVSAIASGTYILEMNSNKGFMRKKFIKE